MTALRIPSPFSSSRRRTASPVVARVRGPEPLESRAMMATFSVVAPDAPVNGSTFRSLQDAGEFVRVLEEGQGTKVGCIEELAWRNGWIDDAALAALAEPLRKSGYGDYLVGLLEAGPHAH